MLEGCLSSCKFGRGSEGGGEKAARPKPGLGSGTGRMESRREDLGLNAPSPARK